MIDRFEPADDPSMPLLRWALDPGTAARLFERRLPQLIKRVGRISVRAIHVKRYKRHRRCLLEYDLVAERLAAGLTLMGKCHARRLDRKGFNLQRTLYHAGFATDSHDGISVPEPVGLVPELHMWLQIKVPGTVSERLLVRPEGVAVAARIAAAIHKLHRTHFRPWRRHAMADELRILHNRLGTVCELRPEWKARICGVLSACARLGNSLAKSQPRGIHRDFYPAQVLIDGPRLYLVDFDLYAEGNPALDVGNFTGHLIEHSLRSTGNADTLNNQRTALEEHFVALAGQGIRNAIRVYETLTLARHIYLSTQFAERRHMTERLLELCEQRLNIK